MVHSLQLAAAPHRAEPPADKISEKPGLRWLENLQCKKKIPPFFIACRVELIFPTTSCPNFCPL
jgi:hypothetical protein